MPNYSGKAQHFYPRIVYGDTPTTLDLNLNPVHYLEITELDVRAENVSLGSFREVLHIRDEVRVRLVWDTLRKAEVDSLRTFWNSWGKLGRQSVLTLSMVACTGQYEYDAYNTYFTRAELMSNPFDPKRRELALDGGGYWNFELVFRQGEDESA